MHTPKDLLPWVSPYPIFLWTLNPDVFSYFFTFKKIQGNVHGQDMIMQCSCLCKISCFTAHSIFCCVHCILHSDIQCLILWTHTYHRINCKLPSSWYLIMLLMMRKTIVLQIQLEYLSLHVVLMHNYLHIMQSSPNVQTKYDQTHISNIMNLKDHSLISKKHTRLTLFSYVDAYYWTIFKSIAFTYLKLYDYQIW